METLQSLSPSINKQKLHRDTVASPSFIPSKIQTFLSRQLHYNVHIHEGEKQWQPQHRTPINLVYTLTKKHQQYNYTTIALSPSHIIKNSLQLLQLMVSLIQCSSHSRDATVSLISAATIKPFDPHHSWHVPKFHSDTTSSFTCRWWRWRWWWWCGR